MSEYYMQTEGMKELEKSLNHHMKICEFKNKIKRLKAKNARLKAEVERLTAFTTRTIIPNEQLQAQVERLTNAGDAMAELVEHMETVIDMDCGHEEVEDWHAAKEGKQP